MTSATSRTYESLSRQLHFAGKQQFTGVMEAQSSQLGQSFLHFCQGRIFWASGGVHPLRRWKRLIHQWVPTELDPLELFRSVDVNQGQDYLQLQRLVREQTVSGDEAAHLVRATIVEMLFDLVQMEQMEDLSLHLHEQQVLDPAFTLFQSDQALAQAFQDWQPWVNAGLGKISLNLSPAIKHADQLEQQVSPQVFRSLMQVIDGDRTLRDLAILIKQDPVIMTRALRNYIRRGLMELSMVGDLAPTVVANAVRATGQMPLIAYVEDGTVEQQIMKQIILKAGYRFLGIQNSVYALPTLLDNQPDLIFLDLVMPVANGIEICSQLRRTQVFRHTPIVFMTSNTGIIDRLRARIVSATEYLTKPIEEGKVYPILEKYLTVAGNFSSVE
jgi:chemotaxis family two-component system response regulator PixG